MPLDEIWRIVHTPDSLTPFWAERRLDSPLASIAGPSGDADPLSQATLRARYRTDIQSGDSLSRYGDARAWTVGETLEVGRRRYLDMAVATYPVEGAIIVDPTPGPDPTPPADDYVPPTGWGVTVDGTALQTLTVATIAGDGTDYQWNGTWEAVADATGTIDGAMLHLGSGLSGPYHMASHVVRTGRFCTFAFYGDLLTGADESDSMAWKFYALIVYNTNDVLVRSAISSSQVQTRTQHPVLIGDEIRLVNMADYETFAGRA